MSWEARGWMRFAPERDVLDWCEHALPVARAAVADVANAHWHVCEGTWFVGVDVLPNSASGAINGSVALAGSAVDFIKGWLGSWPALHPAQISVTYPGYPRPRARESTAAFRYRQRRDAAHVDGILAEGPERRRFVREPHAFILGIALTDSDEKAAPLVVWDGSHHIMQDALSDFFSGYDPDCWGDVDVTEIYTAARRRVFESCVRRVLPLRAGEVALLHPLVLHGVASWDEDAQAGPDGRMIAYFRPKVATIRDWLTL